MVTLKPIKCKDMLPQPPKMTFTCPKKLLSFFMHRIYTHFCHLFQDGNLVLIRRQFKQKWITLCLKTSNDLGTYILMMVSQYWLKNLKTNFCQMLNKMNQLPSSKLYSATVKFPTKNTSSIQLSVFTYFANLNCHRNNKNFFPNIVKKPVYFVKIHNATVNNSWHECGSN